MAAASAARLFQVEFDEALDALESERGRARSDGYEFTDFTTFLEVHEEAYRYLVQHPSSGEVPTIEQWLHRVAYLSPEAADHSYGIISQRDAIFYYHQDQTHDALIDQGLEPDILNISHGMQLRFQARLAAIREFKRRLQDPALVRRFALGHSRASAVPPRAISTPETHGRVMRRRSGAVGEGWEVLTAEQAGKKFVEENPRLLGSATGKREAKWTPKTLSQFNTAMRLLQKSMRTKPFWSLSGSDLQELLTEFDALPPNHHKTPRHKRMTLAEICPEARQEVKNGTLDPGSLGLHVPTLNRHFRFIRMAHDWMSKRNSRAEKIDWSVFTFQDSRPAREQREAFRVDLARKIFRLPPWHGCESNRRRMNPGRRVFHDSLYWVFPILWYSGMRREEACKLQVADIACSEEGIWYFCVADTDAGRVKSASSRRKIPIADALLNLGLLEFVQACHAFGRPLLFPELVSGTRRMGDTYYRLGWTRILKSLDADHSGATLHGIRHMVADELKAAGLSEEVRADLLGHSLQSETAGRYSKSSRLRVLRNAINTIPNVTVSLRREAIVLS